MNAIVSLAQVGRLNIVDELHPAVAALDLERLKFKYTASSEAEMSVEEWDEAEREYRRFLTLKACYPLAALVPTKQVDEVWHAHILDTEAYHADCMSIFGRFLHHYPYFGIYGKEDYQNLVDAFGETRKLYERHFGEALSESPLEATRCEGHACHVPTTCACRSPGACK